jgi:hypothetical protein
MPHKRFQTRHAIGVIDAEIAEKGHLWTKNFSVRSEMVDFGSGQGRSDVATAGVAKLR